MAAGKFPQSSWCGLVAYLLFILRRPWFALGHGHTVRATIRNDRCHLTTFHQLERRARDHWDVHPGGIGPACGDGSGHGAEDPGDGSCGGGGSEEASVVGSFAASGVGSVSGSGAWDDRLFAPAGCGVSDLPLADDLGLRFVRAAEWDVPVCDEEEAGAFGGWCVEGKVI